MNFIGIDPGKSGAIAVIHEDGTVETATFDERDYLRVVSQHQASFATVEKVHAFRGQGVSSMFNFGMNFGWIQGLIYSFSIPMQLVDPRKWLKHYGLDNDKQKHIECARRLFPTVNLKATERCKKDNDGIADALLLAEYGRRMHSGAII